MQIKLYCDGVRTSLTNLDFAIELMLQGNKNDVPSVITIMNK